MLEDQRALFTKRFRVMGGPAQFRFVTRGGVAHAESVARKAIIEAERLELKYSRFLPGSVVSRINRNAGRTPVAVDEETAWLVRRALDLACVSGGAFDPTVGVLRRLWNFHDRTVPTEEILDQTRPLVDHRELIVRDQTVFLRRPGMDLDLGGVVKEYAVDRLADLLQEEGAESAIVDLAGDLRTMGSRGDGRPWNLGVADPRNTGRCRFSIRVVGDAGVASSGDYERYFLKDGVRYHHLLDARTGRPARGVSAVTAIASNAFDAGLAATAAFLLGPENGIAHLESLPRTEGVLITEGGTMLATTGMHRISDIPGSLYARYPRI